ncbi:MAG: OsmC family protein [Chloroflexi bacterium]|nr:OsmC family protein [Chloroflexota bacterium]
MSDHAAKVIWNGIGLSFIGITDERDDIPIKIGWREEGNSEGLSPMALVLQGMAGCTAMDVVSILTKKRQNLTFCEVEVFGEQQEEHPRVYRHVRIHYRFGGADLSQSALERAIELSITRYCPVNAIVREVADIVTSYEIVA